MSLKRSLFRIFGPVVVAAVAVVLFLLLPTNFGKPSKNTLEKAAVSMSANVLKGDRIKSVALNENYVPFFGSSELSRMDAFHPSVLAKKYDRDYRPFLLGAPGTQSLTHFFALQTLGDSVKGKKAVFIVSPQWFVPKGVRVDMFSNYYSPLQTINWLQKAGNTTMDRYAASRLLHYPSGTSDAFLEESILRVAAGQVKKNDINYYANYKLSITESEDDLFSRLFIKSKLGTIDKEAAKLPATYDEQKLDELAFQIGAEESSSNNLQIKNSFYNGRLSKVINQLKGSQSKFDYEKSPEYSDFQLLLNEFKKLDMDVLFVIPPVNARWSQYTGLSADMLKNFNTKIKYQLKSQGFDRVLDMMNDGKEDYFMEDTIHIGWRGWLKMDQSVRPFLTSLKSEQSALDKYKINNNFYSKKWQQLPATQINSFK